MGIQNQLTAMEQQIMRRTAVVTLAQRQQALGIQLTALTEVMRGLAAATAAAMQMQRLQAQDQQGKVQSQRICLAYPVSSQTVTSPPPPSGDCSMASSKA